ncbi:SIR2 family NAD-dependent protein deacylase [Corallococcus sp. M7]
MPSTRLEALLDLARGPLGESVLVVTGAGISLASGIPTFRGTDPGAVWANEVMEKGTYDFFLRKPHESWRIYLRRAEVALAAKPNPAHFALAQWERWQEQRGRAFTLVTQNVDTLHEQAGSRALIKVHGSLDRARCTKRGCGNGAPRGSVPLESLDFSPFHAFASPRTVPRCPRCNKRMRPHILWFDEFYAEHQDYGIQQVEERAKRSRLVLFIGTSFSVGVTDRVSSIALLREAKVLSIDPSGTSRVPGIEVIPERAEELLPRWIQALTESP